jgi:thiamine-monophosphate kinase
MESDLLRWLREHVPPHPLLKLGIGDDAAVLATAGRGDVVVTTDLIAEGVDFSLSVDSPRRIGHKALAINLSDLAAMAANPLAAVIALNLPRQNGACLAVELYEGLLPLAERFHLAVAGGDTNSWDGPLVISVTALGEATLDGPLCRSGAKPGDRIVVTGQFGGSILGRHLDVEPRVDEALLLNRRYRLHAGIDCSDGLSLDLWRICQASRCGAIVDSNRVPIAEAATKLVEAINDGSSSLMHALSDGEDFELILAVPPESAERMLAAQPLEHVALTDIGEFVSAHSLSQRDKFGKVQPLQPAGYEHQFS